MIISTDSEKAFDKIQHQFMIKISPESGHRGNLPQRNKVIYNKPTANILKGEKLKAFPLRSRTRQGCPLLLRQEIDGPQAEQLESSPVDRYSRINITAGARGAESCLERRQRDHILLILQVKDTFPTAHATERFPRGQRREGVSDHNTYVLPRNPCTGIHLG